MSKKELFYLSIVTLFCVMGILSNIIASKILQLGSVIAPAGLLTYPLTFCIGDLVTELYGRKRGQYMVILGFAMNILAASIIHVTLTLPAHDPIKHEAFSLVFSHNSIIVFASLCAYLIAQLTDINLYALIYRLTGSKNLWLRSNVSTLISQALDTVIVILITFWWGLGYDFSTALSLMISSYLYKALFAVAMTPVYYYAVKKSMNFIGNKSPYYLS